MILKWEGILSTNFAKVDHFFYFSLRQFEHFFVGIGCDSITFDMVPVTTDITLYSFEMLGDISPTCSTGVPRIRVVICRFSEVAHGLTDFRTQKGKREKEKRELL